MSISTDLLHWPWCLAHGQAHKSRATAGKGQKASCLCSWHVSTSGYGIGKHGGDCSFWRALVTLCQLHASSVPSCSAHFTEEARGPWPELPRSCGSQNWCRPQDQACGHRATLTGVLERVSPWEPLYLLGCVIGRVGSFSCKSHCLRHLHPILPPIGQPTPCVPQG